MRVDNSNIAAIVLAGGRSSRMGQNKAFLKYHGVSMLDHTISLLKKLGLNDIYVSGNVEGYRCIPDEISYQGPAKAIVHIIKKLHDYSGVLFVPVDMPLLEIEVLERLIKHKNGAYYKDWPLPAFVTTLSDVEDISSVHNLLVRNKVEAIPLLEKHKKYFVNINTPKEWEKVIAL